MDPKINTPEIVATELFQLVSDYRRFNKYKAQKETQKVVLSKFSDMTQSDIISCSISPIIMSITRGVSKLLCQLVSLLGCSHSRSSF